MVENSTRMPPDSESENEARRWSVADGAWWLSILLAIILADVARRTLPGSANDFRPLKLANDLRLVASLALFDSLAAGLGVGQHQAGARNRVAHSNW